MKDHLVFVVKVAVAIILATQIGNLIGRFTAPKAA